MRKKRVIYDILIQIFTVIPYSVEGADIASVPSPCGMNTVFTGRSKLFLSVAGEILPAYSVRSGFGILRGAAADEAELGILNFFHGNFLLSLILRKLHVFRAPALLCKIANKVTAVSTALNAEVFSS